MPNTKAVPTDAPIFDTLDERDVLVHHPYDSFTTTVQRLVEEAAADPRVLAIKQTLYRTSGQSPIVDALIDAAEAGKQVVVVVEIKARFDEKANITWARKLEEAGCHVVYGFVGWKTHAKLMLIVRQAARRHPAPLLPHRHRQLPPDDGPPVRGLRPAHLRPDGRRGRHRPVQPPHRLQQEDRLPPPAGRPRGAADRDREPGSTRRPSWPGRASPRKIAFKSNAIVDEAVIDALYRASQAGVDVDLWIRGMCALKPGVPGLSETIRVRSVLGRFLEHSRIYAFGTGDPDPEARSEIFLGSADMMHRNLDRRVESLVLVGDPGHCAKLRELIAMGMDDGTSSWWLDGDGNWTRHARDVDGRAADRRPGVPDHGQEPRTTHRWLTASPSPG